MPDGELPTIRVIGDITVDWAILAPETGVPGLYDSYRWERPAMVQISSTAGSAAFITEMLEGFNRTGRSVRVQGPTLPDGALTNPADARVTRTYGLWQEYPTRVGSRDRAWRMRQFLGLESAVDRDSSIPKAPTRAQTLVIDDANLGFRERRDEWSSLLQQASALEHVVLKMSAPLGDGPLWQHLVRDFSSSLTVYCSVGDLRKEYAPVGQPLSWERAGSDVVDAVLNHPSLVGAARVVVSHGLGGAVIVEPAGAHSLVFDPLHQEGDWERSHPGSTPGLGTSIVAALALSAATSPDRPDWCRAVHGGLIAGRLIHKRGFSADSDGLSLPTDAVEALQVDNGPFHVVEIPNDSDWQITAIAFRDDKRQAAAEIVLHGDEVACPNLPMERMGAWSSIDRTEIESMRSVRHIMREYLQRRRTRPLSLAVFGPPGAGKSFAIKQMAREWIAGGTPIEVLEFNLSQFSSDELPRTLQRVRDCAVEQRLPLVFWDEFDTAVDGHELGWLARFLAPMQDGLFVEDGISRPIGPAIFIFAGGTHATMASFKDRSVELPGAKATDFLSRLRGYVDILGPNPAHRDDRSYVLRRALLLRALLTLKAPQLLARGTLQIDPGVLRAFLNVTSYVHGARSMEAILDMSALSGKLRYERSALPPQHQLALHVDAGEFLSLVRETD